MRIDFDSGWGATFSDDVDAHGVSWGVVRLHPASDGAAAIGVAEGLRPALHERAATHVLVEMDEVFFLSSSLIGELVRLHKWTALAGGALRLSAFQPACFEALKITRLDGVFNHYLNRAEALGK